MQCEELRWRLHQLLDQRRHPDADPRIVSHAQRCGQCRELLDAYDALYDGLESMPLPPSDPGMALRVLGELRHVRRGRQRRMYAGIGIVATAASLLITAGLSFTRTNGGSDQPNHARATAWDRPSGGIHRIERLGTGRLTNARHMDAERQYLAMYKMTVDVMTALPRAVLGTVPETRTGIPHGGPARWIQPVANSMRPLTSSVSAALGVLRHTLPGKPHNTKSPETT